MTASRSSGQADRLRWPMQHPVQAALIWSVIILAVAAPAATHFFKRKTTK